MTYEDLSSDSAPWREDRRKRRKRRGGDAGGGAIALSNASITDAASIGDTVGTLLVVGGVGSYTFTLTNDAGGKYSITGALLKVAANPVVGSAGIVVHADNGAGSTIDAPFTIVVSSTAALGLKFDYSSANNQTWMIL